MNRRGFIGGSDVAAILGLSPWKDRLRLYMEKTGELELDQEESKAMRRGKILEPAIGQLYSAEHDVQLLSGTECSLPQAAHFRCQIDAIEHVADGFDIPIEIKSASEYTRGKWGKTGTDEAPTYYCTQLHWQMMALDVPIGRIVALLGSDDLRVYTLERDAAIDKFLLSEAAQFWELIESKTPPAIDFEHPKALETAELIFSNPNATEILKADDALRDWRNVYRDCVRWIGKYEKTRDMAKAHLLHSMRNAGVIDFDDGDLFIRKIVKRRGFVVAPTSYVEGRFKKGATGEVSDAPQLEGPE